ncbi:hypothetical protein LEP1GSC047_2635 [Leptospira inadai serovar Lyme str. 10]|uniref:Uncharacterized protein n=1 Tax=Leptospira inadai serovar Lyme str. 10 TaxID=1049790 RepID=V6HCM4_9LEPT|nr:hypothetical protein LEP1GSC047_2635 [Leptospira inadai serovar Lyme str. 10]
MAFVKTSAVEEPNTDWLAPPPKTPPIPPFPVWIITSRIRKRLTKTKRTRIVPVINPILQKSYIVSGRFAG